MRNELLNLQQLIAKLSIVASEEDLDIDFSELKEEINRTIRSIHDEVIKLSAENGKTYLRHHQLGIQELVSSLKASRNTDDKKYSSAKQNISFLLEDAIYYLQAYFPNYFDHDASITESAALNFFSAISEKVGFLKFRLSNSEQADSFITVLESINQQLEKSAGEISFNRSAYLLKFLDFLLDESTNELDTLDLITLCCSFNFNYSGFYHFACGFINSEIEHSPNISLQYKLLNYLKKRLIQVMPITSESYNDSLPNIMGALLRFIDGEMDYIKSMDAIAVDLSSGSLADRSYKVNFTVRQLAFFIHLQVQSGIIHSEKPKLLHEYITSHYSTREQERISIKSFKNAYYGGTGDDIEKVIEKLVEMLALAQEKY